MLGLPAWLLVLWWRPARAWPIASPDTSWHQATETWRDRGLLAGLGGWAQILLIHINRREWFALSVHVWNIHLPCLFPFSFPFSRIRRGNEGWSWTTAEVRIPMQISLMEDPLKWYLHVSWWTYVRQGPLNDASAFKSVNKRDVHVAQSATAQTDTINHECTVSPGPCPLRCFSGLELHSTLLTAPDVLSARRNKSGRHICTVTRH